MKILARPDPEPLHVLAAQLRLWLLDVCVWLAACVGRRMPRAFRIMLREDIREVFFRVRLLVFLLAMTERKRRSIPMRTERPASTPPGFRRAGDHTNPLRLFKRAVRLRARDSAGRIAELREIMGNLDRWVKRVLAHLARGPHGARLTLRAAPATPLHARATCAPSCADTS